MDMKYYYLKLYFLLKYPFKNKAYTEVMIESMYNEDMDIVKYARHLGNVEVRNTLSYKLGSIILQPVKFLLKKFNKITQYFYG